MYKRQDPNFATTITNKLTDLRTALTEEVNRAKEAEAALGAAVAAVQDNLEYGLDQINKKIDTVKADLKAEIDRVEKKVDKNAEDIKDLEDKVNQGNDELEKELKDLIQKEKDERIAADNEIKESVNELKTLHINDKAALEAKIAEETANRTNADTVLDSKINEEITNRQADTLALQGKIDQEKVDRQDVYKRQVHFLFVECLHSLEHGMILANICEANDSERILDFRANRFKTSPCRILSQLTHTSVYVLAIVNFFSSFSSKC